jgi:hypothetical protein
VGGEEFLRATFVSANDIINEGENCKEFSLIVEQCTFLARFIIHFMCGTLRFMSDALAARES